MASPMVPRSLEVAPEFESSVARPLCVALTLTVSIGLLAGSPAAASGPIVGWGAGASPSLTASAIAEGSAHSCAIQAGTGIVVCWGENFHGGATPPPSVDGTAGTASAIAAGHYYSCAIQ